jgi:hypothetical protein
MRILRSARMKVLVMEVSLKLQRTRQKMGEVMNRGGCQAGGRDRSGSSLASKLRNRMNIQFMMVVMTTVIATSHDPPSHLELLHYSYRLVVPEFPLVY